MPPMAIAAPTHENVVTALYHVVDESHSSPILLLLLLLLLFETGMDIWVFVGASVR